MHFEPYNFYHVYNRSFNRALLCYKPANYLYFLRKINSLTGFCDILAYCLMPNHYHLLLYIGENAKGYAHLSNDGGQNMQKLAASELYKAPIRKLLTSKRSAVAPYSSRNAKQKKLKKRIRH